MCPAGEGQPIAAYEAASGFVLTDNLAASERPGFPRTLFRWGMPRAEQVDPDVLLDPDTGNTFLNAKFNFYVSSEVSGNHYVLDYVV